MKEKEQFQMMIRSVAFLTLAILSVACSDRDEKKARKPAGETPAQEPKEAPDQKPKEAGGPSLAGSDLQVTGACQTILGCFEFYGETRGPGLGDLCSDLGAGAKPIDQCELSSSSVACVLDAPGTRSAAWVTDRELCSENSLQFDSREAVIKHLSQLKNGDGGNTAEKREPAPFPSQDWLFQDYCTATLTGAFSDDRSELEADKGARFLIADRPIRSGFFGEEDRVKVAYLLGSSGVSTADIPVSLVETDCPLEQLRDWPPPRDEHVVLTELVFYADVQMTSPVCTLAAGVKPSDFNEWSCSNTLCRSSGSWVASNCGTEEVHFFSGIEGLIPKAQFQ